ncbi:MAG: hypothetical protein BGO43_01220 [Gammaproteobacteria bacterium 39-13]|nr:EAL domain-containing protein [Gammaproteobacteria bacterium]OJV89011.1 MAG: hypothetical protein BGO43_01220 [Gammaproteobacteria bacterium 39-13]
MTLSRQLILCGLIILFCLFAGMINFVVKNTEAFLNNELASHSQDTATALGLTLTTIMKNNDVETASRTVDAIWDRGYYKSIVILGPDGSPLVERRQEIKVYGVPEWFIKFFTLKTEPKEAVILDGWQQQGKVKIESNPGFAYQQIWGTFIESLQWFLVTGVLAAILGGILLYIILRPLRAITAQALAICNKQFFVQERLPWTFDLRLVVEAMNNMSKRLKQLFEEQIQISEQLREQAYKDPVSKLGNRRYFDMQFDYILKDKEKGGLGALLLIELKDFKAYNDKHGYQEGDRLLQNVALMVQECCQGIDNALVAHVKGASIIVVLPNKSKETANSLAEKICQQFVEFERKHFSKESEVGSIGIALYNADNNKKDILALADMALRAAQTSGPNQWHCLEEGTGQVQQIYGAQEWREIFEKVIAENSVLLHFQETQMWDGKSGKIYETLMRIKIGENIISAGIFMPMAEQLNQILAMDKLVIQNVVQKILNSKAEYTFSVNVSPSSLEDENFQKWLLEKLKSLGKKVNQLIIELPEYGVVNRIKLVREFFLKISSLGSKTAIDHYGKNFSSFSYLYNLKLNYLKIDGGFIKSLNESEENQFFVRSLVDIAHSLGILVVAESVESEAEYKILQQLKVDGGQGYFIGKPKELEI